MTIREGESPQLENHEAAPAGVSRSTTAEPRRVSRSFDDEPTLVRATDSAHIDVTRWHVRAELSAEEVKRLLDAGVLPSSTLTWRPGQQSWQPVQAVAELAVGADEPTSEREPSKIVLPPPPRLPRFDAGTAPAHVVASSAVSGGRSVPPPPPRRAQAAPGKPTLPPLPVPPRAPSALASRAERPSSRVPTPLDLAVLATEAAPLPDASTAPGVTATDVTATDVAAPGVAATALEVQPVSVLDPPTQPLAAMPQASHASLAPQAYSLPPRAKELGASLKHGARAALTFLGRQPLVTKARPWLRALSERWARSPVVASLLTRARTGATRLANSPAVERLRAALTKLRERWAALPVADRVSAAWQSDATIGVGRYHLKRRWVAVGALSTLLVGVALVFALSGGEAATDSRSAAAAEEPVEAVEHRAAAPARVEEQAPTPSPEPAIAAAAVATTSAIAVESLPTMDEEDEEDETSPTPSRRAPRVFKTKMANRALGRAAGIAGGCVQPGARLSGKVQLTFSPSGKPASVKLLQRTGNAKVDQCVIGVFKRVRVPAYSGGSVSVAKSFVLKR